jgi:hypothetical protein
MSDITQVEMCNARVSPPGIYGSFQRYQCKLTAWKDGFCKQHHPDSVKERCAKSEEHRRARIKETDWYKLDEALKRIAELEKPRTCACGELLPVECDRCKRLHES